MNTPKRPVLTLNKKPEPHPCDPLPDGRVPWQIVQWRLRHRWPPHKLHVCEVKS